MAYASRKTDTRLTNIESLTLLTLAIGGGCVVFLSGVYYLSSLPAWCSWVTAIFAFLLFLFFGRQYFRRFQLRLSPPGISWPLLLVSLVADLLLLATFFISRTDEGLVSPWQILPIGVFGLFFLATFFALLSFRFLPPAWRFVIACFHTFVACSVSSIVYTLGFGFDPFVHEAAINYIIQFGEILPKQPFYLGQYVLVASLSHLFGASVQFVQAWLVPVLSSLLLPVMIHFGWKYWGDGTRPISAPFWLPWIFPFAYFTFTVPFNLAFLLLLLCAALLPIEGRLARMTRFSLALASLAIHPLAGLPATILVLVQEFASLIPRRFVVFLTLFISTLSLYGALAVYTLRNTGILQWPTFSEWSGVLLTLFRPPFVTIPSAPLWSALYIAYALWPWLLIIAGIIALGKIRTTSSRALVGVSLGVFGTAILSAATLRYRNIIEHEQFEFAFRLLSMLPWLFLPGWIAYLGRTKDILKKNRYAFLLALGILAAWHIAYPQLNPVMHVYSPGVSRTDFEAVDAMERIADGKPYLALAPQLTSAAALRRIGFSRSIDTQDGDVYPYAIPTGGFLYGRYLEIFYQEDVGTPLQRAWEYAPVDRMFVAVPYAWDDGHIDAALEPMADERLLIDESIRLYVFSKKP